MKELTLLTLLIVLMCVSALAGPTLTYQSQPVQIYSVLDNFWWNADAKIIEQWNHSPVDNPFPGGQSAYDQALQDGLIQAATLTVITDDLDLGNSAHIWLKDKDGVWHFHDRFGNTMWLNTMAFADNFGLHQGPGNPLPGHITISTFQLDPHWLDGVTVALILNWVVNGSLNQMEIETATLSITAAADAASTVPVPGAALLTALGVGIVGWLRGRKAL